MKARASDGRSGLWALAVLVVFLCGSVAQAADWLVDGGIQYATVQQVGGTNWIIDACDMNDAGQVTGEWRTNGDQVYANGYIWTEQAGLRDLGTLDGWSSQPYGINNAGQIVGWAPVTGGGKHAFLWTAQHGMQDLGVLPGCDNGEAKAVNDAGQVVGFSNEHNPWRKTAWVLTELYGMCPLGALGVSEFGEWTSCPSDINNAGLIVGFSSVTGGSHHAFWWTAQHGMRDLGVLPGCRYSTAYAVNNAGQVVGESGIDDTNRHAFVWTEQAGMRDLGVLPGKTGSIATDINDGGFTVGSSSDYDEYKDCIYEVGKCACLWMPDGRVLDLDQFLPPDSPLRGTLIDAIAINNSNEVLVSSSVTSAMHLKYFILSLPLTDSVTVFTAYNDLCWAAGQTTRANVTRYSRAQGGALKDFGLGHFLAATLTVNDGGDGPYANQGADAWAGTDASDAFAGKVDAKGVISYGATPLTLTFAGLDPALRYEVVLFGNRAVLFYKDRLTAVQLGGVRSFANASSDGVVVSDRVVPGDTATLCHGDNTANGYVARFAAIDPGSDGQFVLTVGDGGSANPPKFYANAVMLRAIEPGGEFARNGEWKYQDAGLDLGTSWRTADFDDSAWSSGAAPLGYGRPELGTTVSYGPDAANKHITTYFRKSFRLNVEPAAVGAMRLEALHDDGFVAYLNGQDVARRAMPGGPVTYGTPAEHHNGTVYEWVDLSADTDKLVQGQNVLAVEVHQHSGDSGDLIWDADLLTDSLLPTVEFEAVSSSVSEGTSLWHISVRLCAPSLERVSVDYAAAGGTASPAADYSLGAGTLVFEPGQTEKAIALYVKDDAQYELSETVTVGLLNPVNATVGSLGRHTCTIDDDELLALCHPGKWTGIDTGVSGYLWDVWGSSERDVFAVGDDGVIVRHNGSTVSRMNSGTTQTLRAVWGSGPSDVYAVGGRLGRRLILHYNGARWTPILSESDTRDDASQGYGLYDVWGSGPNDVYVVGDNRMLHYDGRNWTRILTSRSPFYYSVWGSGPSDVYTVAWGNNGNSMLLHFDGQDWTEVDAGFYPYPHKGCLCGTGPHEVFARGYAGSGSPDQIWHYDGGAWTKTSLPGFRKPGESTYWDTCVVDVGCRAGYPSFAVGCVSRPWNGEGEPLQDVCLWAYDGTGADWTWVAHDLAPDGDWIPFAIWCGPDGGVFISGSRGVLMRFQPDTERVRNDFDGDGAADLVCFERAEGNWHFLESGGEERTVPFGWSEVTPLSGDFDGDGATDIAVYHPETGNWYLLQSTAGYALTQFGWSEALPAAADYDGDGKTDIAVYHPGSGGWYLAGSRDGFRYYQFGWSEVEPVPADYDGDGKADIAVYHGASGQWFQLLSAQGFASKYWGWMEALPVPADYDGDGKADIAVYHARGGNWFVSGSQTGYALTQFGWNEAEPIPADYDGDGQADIAVHHAPGPAPDARSAWYLLQSTAGFRFVTFGPGDAEPVR